MSDSDIFAPIGGPIVNNGHDDNGSSSMGSPSMGQQNYSGNTQVGVGAPGVTSNPQNIGTNSSIGVPPGTNPGVPNGAFFTTIPIPYFKPIIGSNLYYTIVPMEPEFKGYEIDFNSMIIGMSRIESTVILFTTYSPNRGMELAINNKLHDSNRNFSFLMRIFDKKQVYLYAFLCEMKLLLEEQYYNGQAIRSLLGLNRGWQIVP